MTKIEFSKDIYKLLGTLTEGGEILSFPDWDTLKELDRREVRKRRDGGNVVRKWMREHPKEVERIREKHITYCSVCHRLSGEHDVGCTNEGLS